MKPQNIILEEVTSMLGHDVYFVGGIVRDLMLGKEPHDYDFTTSLTPDEVEAKVRQAGKHVSTHGKQYGVIKFTCHGVMVEVTTFRTETYDFRSRKPTVTFVKDINRELARRDLTINAMAMRGTRLIDPFGGMEDIRARRIRLIGKAERLRDDPLRMLRIARFAAQLDFDVDASTMLAMCKNAPEIMWISRDLWTREMDKLLVTEYPEKGLQVLADSYLLKFMFPELWLQMGYDQNSPYHELTLWEHTLSTVSLAPNDVDLRWAALLHDIGKPFAKTENKNGHSNYIMHDVIGSYMAEGIAARLKWSNQRRETVVSTIHAHLRDDSPIRAADNASKTRVPA